MEPQAPLIWILTSGRRGDVVQCRAIAEQVSNTIIEKILNPRAPYRWLAPFGPIDPKDNSLITPPYPDLIIASSRHSVPYVKAIQKASNGKCRAIFMKYPGCDVTSLGLTWIPAHDKREGPNIINTLTSPHLVTPEKLAEHKANIDPRIKALPGPRLGIILGGNTKHMSFDEASISAFCKPLKTDLPFASMLVTGSRRTPNSLLEAVKATIAPRPAFIFDGTGDNPYFNILANSDALLVTGDSHNMVSEALASGKQVYVFTPPKIPSKFQWTLSKLEEKGSIKPHHAPLIAGNGQTLDATPEIISKIRHYFEQ